MLQNIILTAKQMYYTSCKIGLSGAAGFQTKAKSVALDAEQQQIIERLGVYKPPRNLADEPSKVEILEKFPKLYRNYTLDTGDIVILRSEYVGKDYSNRWGNYFSHGLLLNSLPDNVWPVDIYEWSDWKKTLAHKENKSSAVELPNIRICNINNAFPFKYIQEFINEENRNELLLPKILQSVFLKSSTAKSIVIKVDLESDATYWIACIQKCFPVSLQKFLNSSTYQFDPRTCLDINVTFGETDLILGETERDYQYYVFDFSKNMYTHIETTNEYAKTIALWISKEPTKLVTFYQLCGYFDIKDIGDDLIIILQLFKSSIGEKSLWNDEESVRIFHFIEKSIKTKHYDDVINIVGDIIKNNEDKFSFDFLFHLVSFYISASKINREHAREFFKLLPILFLSWLVDESQSKNSFVEVLNNSRRNIHNFDHQYSEYLLSEENIANLNIISPRISLEKLGFLLKELVGSKSTLGSTEDSDVYIKRIWSFITPTIIFMAPNFDNLDWLLYSNRNDYKMLVAILSKVVEIISHNREDEYANSVESIAYYLSDRFKSESKEIYRYSILNALAENNDLHDIISSEWNLYFSRCKNKIECFREYYINFLKKNSKYLINNNKYIFNSSWKMIIDNDDKQEISIYWVELCANYLPEKLYHDVLLSASTAISLADEESIDLYDRLIGFRDSKKIRILPDKLYLRQVVDDQIYNSAGLEQSLSSTVHEISIHLNNADEYLYSEFLNEYLPLVLDNVVDPDEHGLIVEKLYIKKNSQYFIKAYSFLFESNTKMAKPKDVSALSYWMGMNKLSKNYIEYDAIHSDIKRLITLRLSSLDRDRRTRLVNYFNSKNLVHSTQKSIWNTIINDSNKGIKAKSFFNKLLRK